MLPQFMSATSIELDTVEARNFQSPMEIFTCEMAADVVFTDDRVEAKCVFIQGDFLDRRLLLLRWYGQECRHECGRRWEDVGNDAVDELVVIVVLTKYTMEYTSKHTSVTDCDQKFKEQLNKNLDKVAARLEFLGVDVVKPGRR